MKVDANKVFQVKLGEETVDIMPTYHPSACLFNLTARKGLTEGIALAMAVRTRGPATSLSHSSTLTGEERENEMELQLAKLPSSLLPYQRIS